MTVSSIILQARRILGDTREQRWSDARLLDIFNSGVRDINKFAGAYRDEHFFEMMAHQSRYPLPTNLLSVTSIWHNGHMIDLRNRIDLDSNMFAMKDQLNVGILEIANPPVYQVRNKRFTEGPYSIIDVTNITLSLWHDDVWTGAGIWTGDTLWGIESGEVVDVPINPITGVVVDPVEEANEFGVTDDLSMSIETYKDSPNTVWGALSGIVDATQESVPIVTDGEAFGVLTSMYIARKVAHDGGSIGYVNKPYRLAGRYGTVTSVMKKSEYIKVLYKALPPRIETIGNAFPLGPSWESPIINWIVGTALQDDNDANNLARSELFLARYGRELDLEMAESSKDYSSASKKYNTKYRGGIA